MKRNRREFLQEVGNGMLIAGLGASLADDLGICAAFASEGSDSLDFGRLQPLVELLQETPVNRLLPTVVNKLNNEETNLKELVAAAALANAETFGGQDYVGYHTEMALLPAYQMSQEIKDDRKPLPVLKVLHRNTKRIQESGQLSSKVLRQVDPAKLPASEDGAKQLLASMKSLDMKATERLFATQVSDSLKQAYNNLLRTVEQTGDVHRFVLAHRSFGLIDIVGKEHAHTMLRQSVRYCVDNEQKRKERKWGIPSNRALLPKLMDQYKLLSRKPGTKNPDDAWVAETAEFIYRNKSEQSMETVAAALGEGISHEAVGEAISQAANLLVLRQGTRKDGGKRCHGDSPGVHSSDAANAWRNMVRVANHRNAVAGLLISGYHTGMYRTHQVEDTYPQDAHRDLVKAKTVDALLDETADAIRNNEQARAAAAVAILGERNCPASRIFDMMRRFGTSEDGRLHAEKYYRTVTEEFATTRPSFRWRQLIALARVTASSYGYDRFDNHGHRAPGYLEACRLLNVEA